MSASAVPEPCASCGGKCCNRFAVPITHLDLLRLQKHTGLKADEFCALEDAQLVSENPYPKVFVREGGGWKEKLLVMGRKKTEHCVFFAKSSGCRVHSARPAVCRTYPFSSTSCVKRKGMGNKRLERLVGMLAPKAKDIDISGTAAARDVFYTVNTVCPRRWEMGEFEVAQVLADLASQHSHISAYWKVANEWNAKGRNECEGKEEEFVLFALQKAKDDAALL